MADYKDFGFKTAAPVFVHQYIAAPVINLLDKERNATILDLGCGNGSLVKRLLDEGFNAYGTDASVSGIQLASQSHPDHFALQDLATDELPAKFEGLTFDTIISTEVIEHLYDPRKFISFCKKVLVKNGGGEIILTTPYHGYLKNLLLSLAGKWDSHANPLFDGGHIKLWSKNTLTQLLNEQGFKVTDFVGCGRVPYIWKSMIIKASI
jgi:2-polyprenyl-3-methyl-5-hydroxy-6-metoxy-1,4-benzoquinol methylase